MTRHSVAHGQDDLDAAWIGGDVLVEVRDVGPLALDDPPARERVVGDDQAALREAREDSLVVADVPLLLGVDEHEIELAVEAVHRLERRPDVERDLRAVRRAVEVPLRERRPLRVELAGVDPPALGQRGGHRERRVAAERADLEHALRPPEPDEQLEEPAGDRPRQHLRHPEHVGGLRRQLGEQVLVRRGELARRTARCEDRSRPPG